MKKSTKFLLLLILLSSCQEVTIDKNEIGVYFKRFGGGIDTNKVYKPGNYKIPNWDYIVTYNYQVQNGLVEYYEEDQIVYKIYYKFKFVKEKLALYHYYLGGEPNNKVETSIKKEIGKLIDNKPSSINDYELLSYKLLTSCKSELLNKYIDLIEIKINQEK